MIRIAYGLTFLIMSCLAVCAKAEMHGGTDFALPNMGERELKQSIVVLWSAKTFKPCGGVLVESDIVITAAHCLPDANSWILVFDDAKKYDAYDPYEIANYTVHPKFSYSVKNAFDIAVIKLSKPVPNFRKTVFFPMELAFPGTSLRSESVVAIGRHADLGAGVYANLTVANPSYSDEEFSLQQSASTGVCNGDSGSPVFIKADKGYILAGILSHFDSPDGSSQKCDVFSVYSRGC